MGQKVHPNGIRLGIVKDHTSVWYADKGEYASDKLLNDLQVREYLEKQSRKSICKPHRDRASCTEC